MRYLILALVAFLSITTGFAKDAGFSFEIPDSLKKNADAVYLFHHTNYTRTSKSDLKEEVHFALTILSDRGDAFAEFILGYDKFSTLSGIECIIYNAAGEKVRKVKTSEIRDYSAYDGFSLFSENRLKQFKALNPTYPYTIELTYETSYKGFMSVATWYPISGFNEAIKEATVTMSFPVQYPIHFKEKNTEKVKRTETVNGNTKSLCWKTEGLKAIENEKFSPNLADQLASVSFSPKEFSFDNSDGTFTDWKSLGQWNYGLLETDYLLSEKTKGELAQLKAKYTTKQELVKQVYKYMQSKTRYVSIQLGIGGVKPFSPQLVDEVGYGDCKALSYYTKALLNEVGIPSCYTIIGVNSRKIEFDDFPNINQMNHAILCVPLETDTVWLECTSQTAPFNHLFHGTTNRKALLVTAEGGKMVTTMQPEENRQKNSAKVKVNAKGEIVCNMTTVSTGLFYDDDFGKLQLSDKELREELLKESPLSDITLLSAKVGQQEEVPELVVDKSFSTRNFVTKSGNRLFVEISPFMNLSRMVAQKTERRNPVYLEDQSVYEDQILLQLPEGYTLEFCPEGKTIESEFGSYQSKIAVENGQVVFHRTFRLFKATHPKEKYAAFIAFVNAAADADKCKVIMKQ
jgi:transglutaminase-like putative cysteine protease